MLPSIRWSIVRTFACAALVALSVGARAAPLSIGVSSDITSMDPHWNNSGPNVSLATHVFEPLTLTDRNGRLIPGLAISWRSVDPTTWEFKLRPGVRFHDGTPLTPDDVVFSIERVKTLQGSPASFASFVRPIVAVTALGADTVRIRTAVPHVLVPYDLNSIMIVSRKAVSAAAGTPADFDTGRSAIGTGPYKLGAFKRGDRVELVRNDAWWGGATTWDRVTFRMMSNDAARLAGLLSGDVDAIENVPTADVAKIAADARFTIVRQTSWRTIFWHMDQYRDVTPFATDKSGKPLAKNPFKDARVRLAISKAINRDAIVSRVMEGLAVPASNLVSPGIFGHNAEIRVEAYDPGGREEAAGRCRLSRRFPADDPRAEQSLRQRRADRRDDRRAAVAGRYHDEGRDAAVDQLPAARAWRRIHDGAGRLGLVARRQHAQEPLGDARRQEGLRRVELRAIQQIRPSIVTWTTTSRCSTTPRGKRRRRPSRRWR